MRIQHIRTWQFEKLATCPGWDYTTSTNYPKSLQGSCTDLLVDLRTGQIDSTVNAADTRAAHERLFFDLTPRGCEYYAGHYRGGPERCLMFYSVSVRTDPRVGSPPALVANRMTGLATTIREGVGYLDRLHQRPDWEVPKAKKLASVVAFAAAAFHVLLTVHPYADGNGHAGRFLTLCILGR